MIAQNVHAAPLALLLEGTAPLETQAQAARLLANLAFQPPNKVVLTEAGAVEALQATLERTVAIVEQTSTFESVPTTHVLVEAAAALGNLSSGRSLRERCADASCPVPAFYSSSSTSGTRWSLNRGPQRRRRRGGALSSLSASRSARPAHLQPRRRTPRTRRQDGGGAGGVIGGATVRVASSAAPTPPTTKTTPPSSEDDDADRRRRCSPRAARAHQPARPRHAAAACDAPIAAGDGRALLAAARAAGQQQRPQPQAEPLGSYHELRRRAVRSPRSR